MTPDGWERHAIGDLLDSCTYGISSRLSTESEGTPVLRMGNIADHRLDLADLKYADLSDKDPSDTLLRRGDVLFNRTNSADKVGKVALVDTDRPLGFASYLLRLRTNDSATPEWLYYLLSSPALQRRLRSLATRGVSQVNINPTRMRALEVAVPPLREQHKIAATLSSVDEVIGKTEAVIEQLLVVKKAMLQQLLTRGLPGHHTRFQRTEIGEIPLEWEVAPLSALAGQITKGTTPTTYGYKYATSGVPFLRVENITDDGRLKLEGVKFISPETHAKLARSQLVPGDLLFSIAGALGRAALVPADLPTANINQAVARVCLKSGGFDPRFVLHAAMGPQVEQQISLARAALAQANLNLKQVGQLMIPLPAEVEQRQISAALDCLQANVNSEIAVLESQKSTKASLMSALLTGEVRVTPNEAAA